MMAKSPDWKIYDADGNYQAACKQPELAAVIVSVLGDGATIRYGHRRVLWTEGYDGEAYRSYDDVTEVIFAKLDGGEGA